MRQNPHGGDIYTKKCRVDFSVNVNPLGAPESVKEAVRKSAESVEQYPDALCRDLTRALSEKEQLPEENILFANGAAELIFALTQALRPKKALIAAPGFAEYEAALSAAGCFIRMYPLQKEKGFLLQDDFCDDLTDDLDLVFLCNPNNPTGLTIPQELLLKILDNCRERNIYLVLDECFIEFLPEPEKVTMQGKLDEYPNLLILRAFTKIYAMPGLRLGYLLCSDEDLLDRISRSMQSWNVSIPAQMAGLAALNEDAYVKEARELIRKERAWMKAELEKEIKGICQVYGTSYEADIRIHGGSVKNAPELLNGVKKSVADVLGKENVYIIEEDNLGGENFAEYSCRVPAVYMFIGIKPEEKEAIPGLHSPEYQFDDTVLAGAAAAFANIAIHGCMGELKEN